MIKNTLFLNALARKNTPRPPVWMMRQAGRYLPEYREIRSKAKNFMDFCRSAELCAQAVLQPIDRYEFDAAILFSDILTIPDAMGMHLSFVTGEGPVFADPISIESDLSRLKIPSINRELNYVVEAVRACKSALQNRVPLIGFAGSPWTLACYMIEGSGSKTFSKARQMLYAKPHFLHQLLRLLADIIADYLIAQVEAGADVVMLFDSWGGLLSQHTYEAFSLQYMQMILDKLPDEIPTILFTKGGGQWLELQAQTKATALGIDWSTDLKAAKKLVGRDVILQGNLDPAALYGSTEAIVAEVQTVLSAFDGKPGHIFNLGHGIYPDINPQAVQIMVDTVRGASGSVN